MLALHSVLDMPKICLGRVPNMSWVIKLPGLWIWQVSEYARVAQGSKYATIWLNMSEYGVTWIFFNITELKFTKAIRVMSVDVVLADLLESLNLPHLSIVSFLLAWNILLPACGFAWNIFQKPEAFHPNRRPFWSKE